MSKLNTYKMYPDLIYKLFPGLTDEHIGEMIQDSTDKLIKIMIDVEERAKLQYDHRILPQYKIIYDYLDELEKECKGLAQIIINHKGSQGKYPLEVAGEVASASDLIYCLFRYGQHLNPIEGPSLLSILFNKFSIMFVGDFAKDLIESGAELTEEELKSIHSKPAIAFYSDKLKKYQNVNSLNIRSSKNKVTDTQIEANKAKFKAQPSITKEEYAAVEIALDDFIKDQLLPAQAGSLANAYKAD